MKKLLSVLLALVLMLGCASVLAEATPAESNLETFEFDGFTMTFDADMAGEIYDKAENQVYFQLSPSMTRTPRSTRTSTACGIPLWKT